ncbi:MAG: GNAT family N-acetyltransferase [Bacteroidota bacterium]
MSVKLPLEIRPVQVEELEALRQLAEATFVAAFATQNTAEDMEEYVRKSFSLTYFDQLFHTPGTFFFFALLGQETVGYLKLNTGAAQTEQKLDQALEIERIYILEYYQGQGFGQQLLNFSMYYARQLGKAWIWLGVWAKNHGAIRFYERHGFTTFSQHDFYLGKDLQIDLLMKRKL